MHCWTIARRWPSPFLVPPPLKHLPPCINTVIAHFLDQCDRLIIRVCSITVTVDAQLYCHRTWPTGGIYVHEGNGQRRRGLVGVQEVAIFRSTAANFRHRRSGMLKISNLQLNFVQNVKFSTSNFQQEMFSQEKFDSLKIKRKWPLPSLPLARTPLVMGIREHADGQTPVRAQKLWGALVQTGGSVSPSRGQWGHASSPEAKVWPVAGQTPWSAVSRLSSDRFYKKDAHVHCWSFSSICHGNHHPNQTTRCFIKRTPFFVFFRNSLKWWSIYTKLLPVAAEKILSQNI